MTPETRRFVAEIVAILAWPVAALGVAWVIRGILRESGWDR